MSRPDSLHAARRAKWEAHYASGNTPWDTQITPPEVQEFWRSARLPASGLALDIGCGPGTNVCFLAELGLTAIGFDIALHPLQTGRQRIARRAARISERAWLVQADVTHLPLDGAGAIYAMDVGCFHGVPPEVRPGYVAGVVDNLRTGGYLQMYAFDHTPQMNADPDARLLGVEEDEIAGRFAAWMEIVEITRARADRYPCRWYLLRKQ
jgi:SAM-dependent methyltransferase